MYVRAIYKKSIYWFAGLIPNALKSESIFKSKSNYKLDAVQDLYTYLLIIVIINQHNFYNNSLGQV